MPKILIVDDHPLYREGVMSALRGHPLRALVLGASSAGEALKLLDGDPTVDLVLVDLRLGSDDGLQALGLIGARHPSIARMLISARSEPILKILNILPVRSSLLAPEQLLGQSTDQRSDQFSFCVSLYEALYGERPFAGKKLSELTANVVQGTIREAPAGTKVPFWVRRILLRGLRSAATERYPTMAELLEALGKDPRETRKKWAVGAAVPVLVLVMLPLMLPAGAEAPMRASIVVESTAPSFAGRSRLECQVVPPSSESSTPVGAVTMMSAVRP